MFIKLPPTIKTYVDAANAGDAQTGSLCFSETATVLDEGETLTGRSAIKAWMEKTKKKYNHQTKPLTIKEIAKDLIMTAEITGNFNGSPLVLAYHFKIKDDLIENLRVSLP